MTIRNEDGSLQCICHEHKPVCDCFVDPQYKRKPLSGFWRWFANVAVTLAVLFMVLAIVSKAKGADLKIPLPRHAPTQESITLAPVVIPAEPKPAKVPFYCKPFLKIERSCAGVKMAAEVMGVVKAKALAIRCGATPEEITQAEACLK
jgi:hypothetical protein